MKSLFAVDVNTNEICGQEFILRKPDSALSKQVDESADTLGAYQKKSGVPLWYNIIEYILLFAAVICLLGFVNAWADNGFKITYRRGAVILYIGIIAFI